MENYNKNIPIYNFIFSSLKDKNNEIRENILLGNIKFPQKADYLEKKNIFESEEHKSFLNNLTNQLNLTKIKEEKAFLSNKVEIINNKINVLKKQNNIFNKFNNNIIRNNASIRKMMTISKSIPSMDNMDSLPLLSENNMNTIKRSKVNLLEIKPIVKRNYKYQNRIMNNEEEENLEKNAKEFIKKINNSKISNLSVRKQKQQKDYLRLKKQIETIEKKRKMREEFEYQRSNSNENKKNLQRRNINLSNIKFNNNKYQYYDNNKKLLKNLTHELGDFNSQFYYNYPNQQYQYQQIFNQNNYEMINPNINDYYIDETINNEPNSEFIKNMNNINNINQGSNDIHPSNINDSLNNYNNSILNTSDKKHLYYFNDLKYEK
jgi:hypothetical protein